MKLSRERLLSESGITGFRPEVLEKVFHLLNLLEGFHGHPFLKDRLALKGGTALNLFLFDVPRLSVDMDLNYVGAVDRETMMAERPRIERAVEAVCSREGMNVVRVPTDHAGGKWRLRYDSALGEGGNLEVDINFMFRVPLWPVTLRTAKLGSRSATQIPVLDLHELAAGKLAALLARQASRDLFDAHRLLTRADPDRRKLRLGFVLYGAMNRKDWRTVSIQDVGGEPRELRNQLLPLLRGDSLPGPEADDWARRLMAECREGLAAVLPLTADETGFLDQLLDHGIIEPDRLTDDTEMAQRIKTHPLLEWKALNVKGRRKSHG